jgi:histidinol dehydrogenase
MERAARNLARAHRAQLPAPVEVETEPGVRVGRRPDPLARVGIYAPGGRAVYPSSVLMAAVPARIAGVREIVLCSPPRADALPAPEILAAAALAGVDRVFAVGGAAAIAALAYGTATVPRVDRIVGPGNAYVNEAKLQVARSTSIDGPAGPSEIVIIADRSADPAAVARELLAQAEHDPLASAVCLALGAGPARAIGAAVAAALPSQPRRDVIAAALAARGALLSVSTPAEAVAFAADLAPEHLMLAVAEPESLWPAVRNAGAVFLGACSSVAFGDYMTGANHVLPTGGLARGFAGLSTESFVRWTSWQGVTPGASRALAADVATLAEAEGLPAHAAAALAFGGEA